MSNQVLCEYYHQETPMCWVQPNEFYQKYFHPETQWIFRGQADSNWGLESTLDRAFDEFQIVQKRADVELGLLRKFKRQYHHYVQSPIENDDSLEWLALMQHYGAPTRLLDWTYSFYFALYIAVKDAKKSQCASVWALDTGWIEKIIRRYLVLVGKFGSGTVLLDAEAGGRKAEATTMTTTLELCQFSSMKVLIPPRRK